MLALTGTNEAVTDTYRRDAWGVLLASTGSSINPHTYVGRERYYRMPEAEMYHLGFRDYAQGLGRFMTVDPLSDRIIAAIENVALGDPSAAIHIAGRAALADAWATENKRDWLLLGHRRRFMYPTGLMPTYTSVGNHPSVMIDAYGLRRDPCECEIDLEKCRSGVEGNLASCLGQEAHRFIPTIFKCVLYCAITGIGGPIAFYVCLTLCEVANGIGHYVISRACQQIAREELGSCFDAHWMCLGNAPGKRPPGWPPPEDLVGSGGLVRPKHK